jgi:hypothetical protein
MRLAVAHVAWFNRWPQGLFGCCAPNEQSLPHLSLSVSVHLNALTMLKRISRTSAAVLCMPPILAFLQSVDTVKSCKVTD